MLYYINDSLDTRKPRCFEDAQMKYAWDTNGGKHVYWVFRVSSKEELERVHTTSGYGFTACIDDQLKEELGKQGLILRN